MAFPMDLIDLLGSGGARGRGRSRKTWEQCVRDDMRLLGLHSEWAILRICGGT